MTAQPAYAPISIGRDEYRIPGLSVERLHRALSLLVAADQLQGDVADGRRECGRPVRVELRLRP